MIFKNNILRHDSSLQSFGAGTITENNIYSGTHPGFVDETAHDYHLLKNSSAIDAGTSNNWTDFEGNLPWDNPNVTNTGSGTLDYQDIGAYEFTLSRINLISPQDGYSSSSSTTELSYSVSYGFDIANCSLIADGNIEDNSNSITKYTTQSFSYSPAPGTYSWQINCTDEYNNQINSTTRSLTRESAISGSGNPGGGGSSSVNKTNVSNLINNLTKKLTVNNTINTKNNSTENNENKIESETPLTKEDNSNKYGFMKIILIATAALALVILGAITFARVRSGKLGKTLGENILDKFIQDARRKGYSKEAVEKMLIDRGWGREEVDKALGIR
jgi:hypothetical protein